MSNMKAAGDTTPERRSGSEKRSRKPAVAQLDTHIGKELRELYSAILEEPIPDRFLDLVRSFEDPKADKAKGGKE